MRKIILGYILIVNMVFGSANLDAETFIKSTFITHDMKTDNILQILQKTKNGTVVILENGEYDFKNKELVLNNKKYISFEGDYKNKVIIKNLVIRISQHFCQIHPLSS